MIVDCGKDLERCLVYEDHDALYAFNNGFGYGASDFLGYLFGDSDVDKVERTVLQFGYLMLVVSR